MVNADMKKKVFIIGASGMIGEALHKIYSRKEYDIVGGDKEVLENDCMFVDITERDSVRRLISQVKPDIVTLTAALSHVDYCEEFPQESEKVNVDGVQNVLDAIDKEKVSIVYFSSDYIFDGLNGPYAEIDEPNPLCVYGRHKLIAEKLVQNEEVYPLLA